MSKIYARASNLMNTPTLVDIGWTSHFSDQVDAETLLATPPGRICDVHRGRVLAKSETGNIELDMPPNMGTADLAVGDWVLTNPAAGLVVSLLERQTVLRRPIAGIATKYQLIAANVDTLMIVSSCNADFNPARLERYLALAATSETTPLLVLTKVDLADDAPEYLEKAKRLSPLADAVAIDSLDKSSLDQLQPWVMPGQTVALVGSSGVGKSTILNGLAGMQTATQTIREDDAKGRHTTTARCLRQTTSGGWLIDTPGMRSLSMGGSSEGIDLVFADLIDLAASCKFSDCAHASEPGCALQAAIATGDLDGGRLQRWQKLLQEDAQNSGTIASARAKQKSKSRQIKTTVRNKHKRRKNN